MHQILGADRNLLASFIQHEVHFALADDFADRGFRHATDIILGVTVVEQRVFDILQVVLDGKLQIDNVFVIGQHQRFAQLLATRRAALGSSVADFNSPHLLHVDDSHALDGERNVPARAGHGGFDMFAELENDAA